MTHESFRRLLSATLVSTLLVALPTLAGSRRRAVAHPPATNLSIVDITGTVLDNVTGQPVVAARVEAGDEHDSTDEQGKFLLRKVNIGASVAITADRTGYAPKTVTLDAGNTANVTIRLTPEATVRLRKIDNTTVDLDFDSMEFGYLSGFAGYESAPNENFCKPDGAHVVVDRSEIRKVNGPATYVDFTPCCSTSKIYKLNVELKNGTTTDVYFDDSCSGYSVDVIARNHVTGKYEYVPFTKVAEIVFP